MSNVALSPQKQAEHWFQSAQRLVKGDRFEAALDALERAIALTPTADLYDYQGVVLFLVGRIEDARESYAQALARASTPSLRAQIYFHRALLHGSLQAYDQALSDLSQAVRLNPVERSYREAQAAIEQERAAPLCVIPA